MSFLSRLHCHHRIDNTTISRRAVLGRRCRHAVQKPKAPSRQPEAGHCQQPSRTRPGPVLYPYDFASVWKRSLFGQLTLLLRVLCIQCSVPHGHVLVRSINLSGAAVFCFTLWPALTCDQGHSAGPGSVRPVEQHPLEAGIPQGGLLWKGVLAYLSHHHDLVSKRQIHAEEPRRLHCPGRHS